MNDTQPYLAIGVPILFNGAIIAVLTAHMSSMNTALNGRIDDMLDLLRAELAKNQSELLAKLTEIEHRLDKRIDTLEQQRWKQ